MTIIIVVSNNTQYLPGQVWQEVPAISAEETPHNQQNPQGAIKPYVTMQLPQQQYASSHPYQHQLCSLILKHCLTYKLPYQVTILIMN